MNNSSCLDPAEVITLEWSDPANHDLDLKFYSQPVTPIARLYIKDNALHFEGDMDQAAKMFFEQFVRPIVDEYIRRALTG